MALDSGNSRIWPLEDLYFYFKSYLFPKETLNTKMNSKFCSSNCLSLHVAVFIPAYTANSTEVCAENQPTLLYHRKEPGSYYEFTSTMVKPYTSTQNFVYCSDREKALFKGFGTPVFRVKRMVHGSIVVEEQMLQLLFNKY